MAVNYNEYFVSGCELAATKHTYTTYSLTSSSTLPSGKPIGSSQMTSFRYVFYTLESDNKIKHFMSCTFIIIYGTLSHKNDTISRRITAWYCFTMLHRVVEIYPASIHFASQHGAISYIVFKCTSKSFSSPLFNPYLQICIITVIYL